MILFLEQIIVQFCPASYTEHPICGALDPPGSNRLHQSSHGGHCNSYACCSSTHLRYNQVCASLSGQKGLCGLKESQAQ